MNTIKTMTIEEIKNYRLTEEDKKNLTEFKTIDYCNDLILNIALKIKVTVLKPKFSDRLAFLSRTRVHCVLSEVLGAAFKTFAFCTFRNVFYLSAFTQSFHNNFTAARTKKLVSCDRSTRVFTGSCHKLPPDIKVH